MKILTFYAYRLRDKRFFAFILFVLQAAAKFPVIGQNFAKYVERLQAAYDRMNDVYQKYDQRHYAELVQQADNERTRAFREMNDNIRLVLHYSKDSAQAKDAEVLANVLKLYVSAAGISNETIADRTATIANAVSDFEERYLEQVRSVGVEEYLQNLKQAQQKFSEICLARTEIDAEVGAKAMAAARKQTWEAYEEFASVVNIEAKYATNKLLEPFVEFVNAEIGRNFHFTGQSTSTEGEEGEG